MKTRLSLNRQSRSPLSILSTLVAGLVALALCLASQPWLAGTAVAQSAALLPAPARALAKQKLVAPGADVIRFLDAYGLGDEYLADSLASPLYRAELARRGLEVEERMAIRGVGNTESSTHNSLEFTYVGGARTEQGFVRYLYTARPAAGLTGPMAGPCSVWRVDADPDGRVIWLELVWLFGPETRGIVRFDDPRLLAEVAVPEEAASAGVHPVVGVISESTGEGHYMLGTNVIRGVEEVRMADLLAEDSTEGSFKGTVEQGKAPSMSTYTVDDGGSIRPGAWTFGFGSQDLSQYGSTREKARRIQVAVEDEGLLEGYLESLD